MRLRKAKPKQSRLLQTMNGKFPSSKNRKYVHMRSGDDGDSGGDDGISFYVLELASYC